jgi:hypothetical protein
MKTEGPGLGCWVKVPTSTSCTICFSDLPHMCVCGLYAYLPVTMIPHSIVPLCIIAARYILKVVHFNFPFVASASLFSTLTTNH